MKELTKWLQPINRKLRQVASRAVIKLVNDDLKLQELQIAGLSGETLDGVERFQEYGFTSHPKEGAEAVSLSLGGNRSHTVIVAVDDRRYRLKGLESGEVALYDDLGQKIVLKRDRIEVVAPKVVVISDDISLGGEGGAKVARVGDLVNVGSGSSAGQWPIVGGSDKVKAL
jgi:phage baseplate assembly protein V